MVALGAMQCKTGLVDCPLNEVKRMVEEYRVALVKIDGTVLSVVKVVAVAGEVARVQVVLDESTRPSPECSSIFLLADY